MNLEAIYVGRVSSELPDELVKRMLTACGGFLKWSRTRDPATDVPVSFGFADFGTIEGVWRAARAMNGLNVADDTFIVNVPQKTKQTVDRWHAQQMAKLKSAHPDWDEQKIDETIGRLEELKKELSEIAQEASRLIELGRQGREASDKARVQRVTTMKQRISAGRAAASSSIPNAPTPSSSNRALAMESTGASDGQFHGVPPPPAGPNDEHDLVHSPGGDLAGPDRQSARNSSTSTKADVDGRRSKRRKEVGGASEAMRELLERQQRRISNYESKMELIGQSYESLKKVWQEELEASLRQGDKALTRIKQATDSALPTRKDALEMIEADERGKNVYETLNYLYTIGASPLYPSFNGKFLPSRAPRDAPLDRFNIIDSSSWLRAVAAARAAAREDPRWVETETLQSLSARTDACRDERIAVLRKFIDLPTLTERQQQQLADTFDSHANSKTRVDDDDVELAHETKAQSGPEAGGRAVAAIPDKPFAINWDVWTSDPALRETFANWLLGLSRQLVGNEDCQELTEYILDFVSGLYAPETLSPFTYIITLFIRPHCLPNDLFQRKFFSAVPTKSGQSADFSRSYRRNV